LADVQIGNNRSVRKPRSLLACFFALMTALLTFSMAVSAASATRTYVASQCDNAVYKPTGVILACGDAGLAAVKLHWTGWGSTSAAGVGTGVAKLCEPNCAEGKVAKAPMRLVLSKPRLCAQDGKRHFTRVHYSWIEGAPADTGSKRGTIPMPCSLL
jgi:hypothetical protein